MEKFILDRFEENFAVLQKETGKTVDVEKSLLPDAKEGDVLILECGVYRIDAEETSKRKERIIQKMEKLLGKKTFSG